VTRVLVVEDEESFSDAISYLLRKEGFEVAVCATGPDALSAFDRSGADLVLLDLMLPGLPGSEVCRALRSRSNVPVIMLTAKDSEIDKVVGLELGADDYVTKPFSSRELVARMRAVLRRRGEPDEVTVSAMEAGPVRMDVDRHVVTVRGGQIQLPLKEFELLQVLLRNADRVLTRMQLIDRVWGADYVGDTKTLDVHIKRLRAKIESAPAPGPRRYGVALGVGVAVADVDDEEDVAFGVAVPVAPGLALLVTLGAGAGGEYVEYCVVRASIGTVSSTDPALANVSRTLTVCPLISALLRSRSTTLGLGPSRSAELWPGTAIEPPASSTDLAVPVASTPTSLSALPLPLYTLRNRLAELPLASVWPLVPPRMKASEMVTASAVP
jgi:two-component system, OmpR family, response regulator RegX3